MEFRVTGLDGKVVVITGGARGMGAAYVRGFLAEGANVVAADQTVQKIDGKWLIVTSAAAPATLRS